MPCEHKAVHQEWRVLVHPFKGGNAWINPATGAAFNPSVENNGDVTACREHASLDIASFVSNFGRREQ